MSINNHYYLFIIALLLLTSCTLPEQETEESPIPETEETEVIELNPGVEIWLNQCEIGNTDELLADSVDYLYPEDYYFKPRRMNDDGLLFGELSDEYNSSRYALLALDLNTGEYSGVVSAEKPDQFNQMTVQYCNNDYLIYSEVNTSEGIYAIYHLDLKTQKKTKLFYEINSVGYNTMFADADENGNFMFTTYNKAANDNQLYYVSLDDMKPELIADHAYMPVYVNPEWYCIADEDKLVRIRRDGIQEIQVKNLLGRIYEITAIDESHLLLIDVGNSASPSSRAYIIDMENMTAEYLFRQKAIMEMTEANHQFIKWKGDYLEDGYALRENLFDYINKVYYPIETNYIYMSENGIAYRKFIVPPSEAVPGTMMDRDKTCISYIPLNH